MSHGDAIKAGLEDIERRIQAGEDVPQSAREYATKLRALEAYCANKLNRDLWAEFQGREAADTTMLQMLSAEIEAQGWSVEDALASAMTFLAYGLDALKLTKSIADLWPF